MGQTQPKGEVIVNNAAGTTNLTKKEKSFSDFELIGVVLVTIIGLYIVYHYIKNKFSKRITQEVTRQAVV